jgi:hypothetical protein
MKTTMLVAAVLATLAGCSFDIANPEQPGSHREQPARNEVAAAATGLLIGSEVDAADFALDLGILGREAYRFDGSDPRFTGELLTGGLGRRQQRLSAAITGPSSIAPFAAPTACSRSSAPPRP